MAQKEGTMINADKILESASYFNKCQINDRIFYTKNGHWITRRIIKKGKKSVTVIENGKEKIISFDRIVKA